MLLPAKLIVIITVRLCLINPRRACARVTVFGLYIVNITQNHSKTQSGPGFGGCGLGGTSPPTVELLKWSLLQPSDSANFLKCNWQLKMNKLYLLSIYISLLQLIYARLRLGIIHQSTLTQVT